MKVELLQLLSVMGDFWSVFLLSMIPVIEHRGAIPLGLAMGIPFWETYFAGVFGSLLPAPFILLLLRPVVSFLSRWSMFERFLEWVFSRAEKNQQQIERFGLLGLFMFVAIPAPVTGVWTGSLLAFMFKLPFWPSLAAMAGGTLIAGILVSLAGLGLIQLAGIFSWPALLVLLVVIAIIWQKYNSKSRG